ncbi:Fic family protein [Fusobacterium varium]|uniref:Fic family protein n=1 Tax=Fusobacterium varium TaxID=856 RepID=UPI001F2E6C14|nr:Fic family protein [Fusobacterium varium]MCF2674386.1 Fic family protein [Fusobacterium varium]
MAYQNLKTLYYKKYNIEEELNKRLENPCTLKTELVISPVIKGEKLPSEKYNLFYLPINKILFLEEQIFSNSKKVTDIFNQLPYIAQNKCIEEVMINEIIKTNKIEGVISTKKDISESLNTKKTRFTGIVNKYKEITEGNLERINSVEEIRKIYDDIFKEDILKNPENELDGKLFRKNPVYIQDGIKKIHSGSLSEESIISQLNDLIKFMNIKNVNSLIKACITHYYFEYIHPFYDGNGRFGRFLFSIYLARKIDILTGLSLSYAIFLNKEKYLKLFLETSESKNCGELTFFIEGILEIIIQGQESIIGMLEKKHLKLEYALNYIKELGLNVEESDILFILTQNYIFSNSPLKDSELCTYINLSPYKLKGYIKKLSEESYVETISRRPLIHSIGDKLKKVLE